MPAADLIRAAGVVLLRPADPVPEVLIVHRPEYGDWSLPKGKLEPGEHPILAAIRECDEETGFQAVLGARLPSIRYPLDGVLKHVDFWAARASADEGFNPGAEIDDIRWLPVDQARRELDYDSEADLVDRAVALPSTRPLVLVRHTAAVKRSDFRGKDDAERPLSGKGRSQAKALAPIFAAFGITDIHSSDAVRCHDSVRKAAKHLDTAVQREPSFSEEGFEARPERAARRMHRLILDPAALVVCSHRPVLPTLLDIAAEDLGKAGMSGNDSDSGSARLDDLWDPKLPPGGFIVLHRSFTTGTTGTTGTMPRLVSIERHSVSG